MASTAMIVQHVQRLWCTGGEFCQLVWERMLDVTGDDPFHLWVIGTTVVTVTVYWLVGGLYALADLTGRPRWLRRYKTQPGTNEPVSADRLRHVIRTVLLNQFAVGVPMALFAYRLLCARGLAAVRPLPSAAQAAVHLAVCIGVEEVGFYYSHRALHSGRLYRWVHKQHHEWTAPVAVTAVYCHPVEHVLSNLVPPFAGVLLCGCHVTVAWLWFVLAIGSTLNAHCGYHLPFLPSPEAHDFHHLKFNNCFGVLGILDRLHGTDAQFRRTASFPRHALMLSLVPSRELFPEPLAGATKRAES